MTETSFPITDERNLIKKPDLPTMKILRIITSSSHSPANSDNSAMPKARPPAATVPNPRLNPLLRVAPAEDHIIKLHFFKAELHLFW